MKVLSATFTEQRGRYKSGSGIQIKWDEWFQYILIFSFWILSNKKVFVSCKIFFFDICMKVITQTPTNYISTFHQVCNTTKNNLLFYTRIKPQDNISKRFEKDKHGYPIKPS